MIGLDTNILVRYLTQDDLEQSKIVSRLLEKHSGDIKSLFINNIVICELVWVLERGYKYSKSQIVQAIRQIISIEEFAFENNAILWNALEEYEQNSLDFSDALIGKLNTSYNCATTITLDKSAAKSANFTDCLLPVM